MKLIDIDRARELVAKWESLYSIKAHPDAALRLTNYSVEEFASGEPDKVNLFNAILFGDPTEATRLKSRR